MTVNCLYCRKEIRGMREIGVSLCLNCPNCHYMGYMPITCLLVSYGVMLAN
jgi:hypothetical protein